MSDLRNPRHDQIEPVDTFYRTIRFRSRLEARWAVFLDDMEIDFAYELDPVKLGTRFYLPDFYLPHLDIFAEVKPTICDSADLDRIYAFAKTGMRGGILLLSGSPTFTPYPFYYNSIVDSTPELIITNALLDVFYKRRWYSTEHRLYLDCRYEDFRCEDQFTERYVEAVEYANGARFDRGQSPTRRRLIPGFQVPPKPLSRELELSFRQYWKDRGIDPAIWGAL
jgi:hypothetical protein